MPRHELGAAERRARMIGWRSGDVLRATALVTSYLLALALAWTAREIVLTAFLGVLFGLAAALAPTVRTQVVELRTRVPEAVDRIEAWVNARPGVAGLFLGGHEVAGAPAAAPAPTAQGRTRTSAAPAPVAAGPSLRERITE